MNNDDQSSKAHSGETRSKETQSSPAPETAATENMPQAVPGETQTQQPGREAEMSLAPVVIRDDYRGSDKLRGKVALITGEDVSFFDVDA